MKKDPMTVFYKATQPDGTDFYSGTVDYAAHLASGEPLPLKPQRDDGFECCTNTVYHASTSMADTLIGGSWPCRLFEVDGVPFAEEENKRGFRTLTVVREIDAWQALGPNGEAVAALIERVKTLTVNEVRALAAGRYAARDAARDAEEAAWAAAWTAGRYAGRYAARDAARAAARDAARAAAWGAVGSAAGALVVRDLISAEHFAALYGPWAQVVGEG